MRASPFISVGVNSHAPKRLLYISFLNMPQHLSVVEAYKAITSGQLLAVYCKTSLGHRGCVIRLFHLKIQPELLFPCWILQESGSKHHSMRYSVHFKALMWKKSEKCFLFSLLHFNSCVVSNVLILGVNAQALKHVIFWPGQNCVLITRSELPRLRNTEAM